MKFIKGKQVIRDDSEGSGHFGASRGSRKHNGVDIVVIPGEDIIAPDSGVIVRKASADSNKNYEGFLFKSDSGYEAKAFYLDLDENLIGKRVSKGQKIGVAQDVSQKYNLPNMLPHIHVEIYRNGTLVNAEEEIFSEKKNPDCNCCHCSSIDYDLLANKVAEILKKRN